MTRSFKVTFIYRDIDTPRDEYGVLTSKFIHIVRMFKREEEVGEYASKHSTIIRRGKKLTLLRYQVEQYMWMKAREYSVDT